MRGNLGTKRPPIIGGKEVQQKTSKGSGELIPQTLPSVRAGVFYTCRVSEMDVLRVHVCDRMCCVGERVYV